MAYLLNRKVENNARGTFLDIQANLRDKDYERFDTGLAFILGLEADKIRFGVRYNYGLQKVGKEKSFLGANYTFLDGKNSVIMCV